MKRLFLPIVLLISFTSCEKYKYFTGELPSIPINFEQINTEYDDYNSTAPTLGETFPLCFSSSRVSKGGDYDFVYKLITISFSKTTGELSIYENTSSNLDVVSRNRNINEALSKVNSSNNELGPYLIPVGSGYKPVSGGVESYNSYILLYSNDENEKHNIKLTHNTLDYTYDTIINIDYLSSEANDFYPTLNYERTKFYWSSDRNGNYDFYSISIPNTGDILTDIIQSNNNKVENETALNSDNDDKSPYITNDFMLFSSNRPGGKGGFDLYYVGIQKVWKE